MRASWWLTSARTRRSIVYGAFLALVVSLAAAAASQANATSGTTIENVDYGLCGFPLKITVSNAQKAHAVGNKSVRLTGQAKVTLTNLATGQEVTLSASGPSTFNNSTHTLSFTGHQLWLGGELVPYLATDAKGSLDSNFVLSGARNANVVDPCALVGLTPSVTPVTTPVPWGLPADALAQIGFAGLTPLLGNLVRHDRDHLDVTINGQAVTVPAGIGQAEPQDFGPCPPEITEGDCATGHFVDALVALSPLHTHSTSGIIHIESDRPGVFTLGEFFDEWGVRLSQTCVGGYCTGGGNELRVYVNGQQLITNPRELRLTEHQEIAVVYGGSGAFNSVPSTYSGGWPDERGGGCGGEGEPSCIP